MNATKIVFSPTGGTEKVADALAGELAGTDGVVTRVDLRDSHAGAEGVSLDANALAVIVAPCYAGRVPAVAMERLGTIAGNGAKAVVAIAYGNRAYDDALLELKDGAEAAGFVVVAAVAAIAEHSIARQFAASEPGEGQVRTLTLFARQIAGKMQRAVGGDVAVPGNRPYRKAGSVPLVPKASNVCSSCGACTAGCPVGAIDPKSLAVSKERCIACMRCVAVFPQQARGVSKLMLKATAMKLEKECSKHREPELYL